MTRLKSYKRRNLLPWKFALRKPFSTLATRFLQLPMYSTTGKNSQQYLNTIETQCSTSSNLNKFSLCSKRYAATIKTRSLLMLIQSLQFLVFCIQKMIIYQSHATISKRMLLSMTFCFSLLKTLKRRAAAIKAKSLLMPYFLFCIQKMILYQYGATIPKRLFLWMTICTSLMRTSWLMHILIVVLLSILKLLQKSDRSTENGIIFTRSCEKLKCIPTNDKETVSLMSSITLFQQYNWTHAFKGHGSSTSYVTQPHQW